MAFRALKIKFPGPPAWLWPGPAAGRGILTSSDPSCTIEKLIQNRSPCQNEKLNI